MRTFSEVSVVHEPTVPFSSITSSTLGTDELMVSAAWDVVPINANLKNNGHYKTFAA